LRFLCAVAASPVVEAFSLVDVGCSGLETVWRFFGEEFRASTAAGPVHDDKLFARLSAHRAVELRRKELAEAPVSGKGAHLQAAAEAGMRRLRGLK